MTVRVLYLGGTGRTGSTVLERILGALDGVVSVGEMTWFWYAMRSGGRCSCHQRYEDCEMWAPILREAFPDGIDPTEMYRLRMRHDSRHLPLLGARKLRQPLLDRLGPYPERLARLYSAIASHTGAEIIVDSSKEPHYGYILDSRPELDVRVCHLVRHPSAVAWSWQRQRQETGMGAGHEMETRAPWKSAAFYDVSNLGVDSLWGRTDRYMRVRYEDFTADPLQQLEAIRRFAGITAEISTIVESAPGESPIRFRDDPDAHIAWGNPNRFETGSIAVRNDAEWERAAPPKFAREAWRLCAPVARRYGYEAPTRS